ncbi:MAG: hypothetical protein AB1704_20565 [Pseudomonadota bacterium]
MLTVSIDAVTDAVCHALAQRVGRVIGMKLNEKQRTALLLIASTLQDTATIRDLVAGSAIGNASHAGVASDSIGYFEPVRVALQRVATTRGQLSLFEPFTLDRHVLGRKLDGAPNYIETRCSQCGDRVRWPATSWRDIKRRPQKCSHGHVFAFRGATFIRLPKSNGTPATL